MAGNTRQMSEDAVIVDVEALGSPVVVDNTIDVNQLDMSNQPEILHATLAALENVDVPNANMIVYEHNDEIKFRKEVSTYTADPGTGYSGGFRGMQFENGQDIQFNNARSHDAGFYGAITPTEDGGYKLHIVAHHEGDYFGKIDASATHLNYDINAEGEITSRSGIARTDDFGAQITEQEHGMWTIQAAQTFESNLAVILGGNSQAFINEQRPDSAATSVNAPPALDGATGISTLNLTQDGMGIDAPEVSATPLPTPGN